MSGGAPTPDEPPPPTEATFAPPHVACPRSRAAAELDHGVAAEALLERRGDVDRRLLARARERQETRARDR